ncbi:MAG TPA: PAS domain S-box protein, partial [Thermodesulfovibrionales bacterium]|nr:PAS domain S-box protein [Thermodesulfovibrionales bacterium]
IAVRLIRVTGRPIAWGLISLSISGMAVRRSISLFHYFWDSQYSLDFSFELIGLITSILMLTGVILISPLFKSMAEEIAQRKRAEKALLERERELSNITSNMAEGIYVMDEAGRLSFMNPEAEHILGWTVDELNEKGAHELVHFRRSDGTPLPFEECAVHKVIKTGKRFASTDEVFVRKDGTVVPVSVITAPVMEDGKVVASVTAFQDITERRKTEEEKERLIEALQTALSEVKVLKGLIPVCAWCRKIRDDKGYWEQVESYIEKRSDARFTHGICPECYKKVKAQSDK